MSLSLSSEEFQVFQDQLLKLREEKHSSDVLLKHSKETIQNYLNRIAELEASTKKYENLLARSQRHKEWQQLITENESLHSRIQLIETNFLLQIETLQTECKSLTNERIELLSRINDYETILNNKNSASDDNENKPDDREEPVAADSTQIESLYHRLAVYISQCKQMEDQLANRDVETSRLKDQVLSHDLVVQNLKAKLFSQQESHEQAFNEARDAHTLAFSRASEQAEQRIAGLTAELAASRSQAAFYQAELTKSVQQLEEERAHFMAEFDRLQEAREAQLAASRAGHRETVAGLEQRLVDNQRQVDELTGRLAQLDSRLADQQLQHSRQLAELSEEGRELACCLEARLLMAEAESQSARADQLQGKSQATSQRRKADRQLRDLRGQLDRERRRADELAARLMGAGPGPQRGWAGLIEPQAAVGDPAGLSGDDSNSSVLSSSLFGAGQSASDSVMGGQLAGINDWPSNASVVSSTLSEADLTNVLDRLVQVQDENCDLKRQLSERVLEIGRLKQSLERKNVLIHRYIDKNFVNPEVVSDLQNDDDCKTPSSKYSPPLRHTSTNYRHNADTLTPKPVPNHQGGSGLLNQSISRIYEHMKERRIDSLEFRQLKNICDELMVRNLQLEESLSTLADKNHFLEQRLNGDRS